MYVKFMAQRSGCETMSSKGLPKKNNLWLRCDLPEFSNKTNQKETSKLASRLYLETTAKTSRLQIISQPQDNKLIIMCIL